MRRFSAIDKILTELNNSLSTAYTLAPTTQRDNPAKQMEDGELTEAEKKTAAALMRVNHAGEVSAQGLYRGQAMTAKDPDVKAQMQHAADEENDHLNWCETRLHDLGDRKSLLSPFWYWGSFGIGALAGFAGDKWSLGFVKETEDQVSRHLSEHLQALPEQDHKSRAIVTQMKIDEEAHAASAQQAGAAELPAPIKHVFMPMLSKTMTTLAAKI